MPGLKCTKCEEVFARKFSAKRHLQRKHAGDTSAQLVAVLEAHPTEQSNTGGNTQSERREYQCSACQAPFTRRDTCLRHIKKSHSGLQEDGQATVVKVASAAGRPAESVSAIQPEVDGCKASVSSEADEKAEGEMQVCPDRHSDNDSDDAEDENDEAVDDFKSPRSNYIRPAKKRPFSGLRFGFAEGEL